MSIYHEVTENTERDNKHLSDDHFSKYQKKRRSEPCGIPTAVGGPDLALVISGGLILLLNHRSRSRCWSIHSKKEPGSRP